MILFETPNSNLGESGRIWENPEESGRIWENLGEFGRIWENMGEYGGIQENTNSRKSVRWSAVPVPCLGRLCLKLREQGSGPEGVDDLCFHTYGEFSPSGN